MTEPSVLKVVLRNLALRTTLAIILKQHLLNRFQLKVISNWYCTDGQNFGLKRKPRFISRTSTETEKIQLFCGKC